MTFTADPRLDMNRAISSDISIAGCKYILGVAVLLRLLFTLVFYDNLPFTDDAYDYSMEAIRVLSAFPGNVPYYWPPGTSYLWATVYWLAPIGPWSLRIAQVLLGVLVVWVAILLTKEVSADTRSAKLAGWIAAFYPPLVFVTGQADSQLPTFACLLIMVWSLLLGKRRNTNLPSLIAGVACGLGCLVRPSMTLIAVVVLLLMAFSIWRAGRDRCRWSSLTSPALFIIPIIAFILPVMAVNASHNGGWTISTNNERNFFLGNNEYTPDYKTSLFGSRPYASLPSEVATYLKANQGTNTPSDRKAMVAAATRYIWHHPGRTIYRSLNRLRAFWGFDHRLSAIIGHLNGFGSIAISCLLIFEAGGYIFLMCLIITLLLYGKHYTTNIWILLILVASYMAPYILSFSHSTYHFPVLSLLIPLAGISLAKLANDFSFSRRTLAGFFSARIMLALLLFFAIQFEYAYHLVEYAKPLN